MTLTTLALTFVLSAVVIVAAGTVLARSGDVIAARTGLGRLWVGSVFLALATSLPEITTDIAAVRLGAPDLAAGDLFGSTMANMLILALISLIPAGREIFQKATLDHVLYASLAVVMTCVAAITILVRPTVSVLRVGPASLLLVAMYAVGSRAAYRHGTLARHAAETVEMSGLAADTPEGVGPAVAPPTLRRASIAFAGSSLVILVSAPQFARTAERIAILTGVGTTFLGTWLVGLTTSLPELVTSLAAVRLRAYDLAVGNLFGSNALKMTIFLALANAVEPLRAHPNVVLPEADGRGVVGFLRRLLTDGVADVEPRRWQLVLDTYDDGTPAAIPASHVNVGIFGGSGTGKSYLAGLIAEQLIGMGYTACVVELEGDQPGLAALYGAVTVGGAEPLQPPHQVVRLLRHGLNSVVVDLSLCAPDEKRSYACALLTALLPLRARERDPAVDPGGRGARRDGDGRRRPVVRRPDANGTLPRDVQARAALPRRAGAGGGRGAPRRGWRAHAVAPRLGSRAPLSAPRARHQPRATLAQL